MATAELSNGATIWYERSGSGAPVVQVHGSAFGHRNFERITPFMAERFEVIDFDLPGYGLSSGGPETQDIDGFADQVAEFISLLGHERVHIHGTSFGAMIALTLAARQPAIVDKLVLSCFMARYDNAARMMRGTWKRAATESGMDAVADLTSVAGFARSYHDRDEAPAQLESMRVAFRATLPSAFVAATEAIEGADLSALIDHVNAPTFLIAGAEDNMTPFRPAGSGLGMHQIAEQLVGARTVVIPESGHYLVIEVAEEAARQIIDFLQ